MSSEEHVDNGRVGVVMSRALGALEISLPLAILDDVVDDEDCRCM